MTESSEVSEARKNRIYELQAEVERLKDEAMLRNGKYRAEVERLQRVERAAKNLLAVHDGFNDPGKLDHDPPSLESDPIPALRAALADEDVTQ